MKISEVSLDATDLQILRLLQDEGRLSNARLAERLKLSETPVWRRLRRLEEEGFITGYQALLNRKKLGIGLVAFVRVVFANHGGEQPSQFEQAIADDSRNFVVPQCGGRSRLFPASGGARPGSVWRIRLDGVAPPARRGGKSSPACRCAEIKSSNRLPLPLA